MRTLRNAPSEVLALINEVSDPRLILGHVENYTTRGPNQSQAPHDQFRNMSFLVDRAKDYLLELDALINSRFLKPGTQEFKETGIKVSRQEWAKARATIERFRHDVRLNIATEMIVLNS